MSDDHFRQLERLVSDDPQAALAAYALRKRTGRLTAKEQIAEEAGEVCVVIREILEEKLKVDRIHRGCYGRMCSLPPMCRHNIEYHDQGIDARWEAPEYLSVLATFDDGRQLSLMTYRLTSGGTDMTVAERLIPRLPGLRAVLDDCRAATKLVLGGLRDRQI